MYEHAFVEAQIDVVDVAKALAQRWYELQLGIQPLGKPLFA